MTTLPDLPPLDLDTTVPCDHCDQPAVRVLRWAHGPNCEGERYPQAALLCYPHLARMREAIKVRADEERRCHCGALPTHYHDLVQLARNI